MAELSSGETKWTPAQEAGITGVGRSLLVSAAAGSGKTAILSERCAYLVCDAPEPFRCDVDELLVVTFTEKAAEEMKGRILAALRRRAGKSPSNPRLAKQMALAEQAQVSTLHSFCAKLLRQHFHLVKLDPAFTIMDGEEANLLRLETARAVIADRYENDSDESFQKFVDGCFDGHDEKLVRLTIKIYEMLRSLVDQEHWLVRTRKDVADVVDGDFTRSSMHQELVKLLRSRLSSLSERCHGAREIVLGLRDFPKYIEWLDELANTLVRWQGELESGGTDALATAVKTSKFAALYSYRNNIPGKDIAKSALDKIRCDVTDGDWRTSLRFSSGQWRDGMRMIQPHVHVLLDLIDTFGKQYCEQKDFYRQLDFSDLEQCALQVLREPTPDGAEPAPLTPSSTAKAYHRLFKHVLVDEYQDINELQDAILRLVSHECVAESPGASAAGPTVRSVTRGRKSHREATMELFSPQAVERTIPLLPAAHSEKPNLFCVGDVKQSIYRFRLAEPERFIARHDSYKRPGQHGDVIDLNANFRSRGPLLEAINGVFRRLMSKASSGIDYNDNHQLKLGAVFPDPPDVHCFAGGPIELHVLPGARNVGDGGEGENGDADPSEAIEREAMLVARRIKDLVTAESPQRMQVYDKGTGYRPAEFRDVVILLRSMRYKADKIADILTRAGVPTFSESGTGYFESVEVRDMLALLSVLDNMRQDIPLAAVLRSPLARLTQPDDALAHIRLKYLPVRPPVPFHRAVVRYAHEQTDALSGELKRFLTQLNTWRTLAQRRPVAELIGQVFEETGYVSYVSGLYNGEQRVANLAFLRQRAEEFAAHQRQGLGRFLEMLDHLREESDLGAPSVATEAENVVRVMSIHRSKGLEFPIVVLPDLGKKINMSDCEGPILADRKAGLGMMVTDEARRARYPSLMSTLVRDRMNSQAKAEELRVLYVAMTRAREHLILVGTCDEKRLQTWQGRWGTHRGPLPADDVMNAQNMLDWVGSVASCPRDTSGPVIEIIQHTSEEIRGMSSQQADHGPPSPRLAQAIALAPLEPPPATSSVFEKVIDAVTYRYAFDVYASEAAVTSVTARTKREHSAPLPQEEETLARLRPASALELPVFMLPDEQMHLSAADVGTATHLVLEHLDLAVFHDRTSIESQVQQLIADGFLDERAAAHVSVSAIEWFLATDVGRLLRENVGYVRRELPVYFSAQVEVTTAVPATSDPLDRLMVRGRLDLFLDLPTGGIIIDFKTDRLSADAVDQRASEYAPQLAQYRDAMCTITGRPVAKAYLIFLTPRVVKEV